MAQKWLKRLIKSIWGCGFPLEKPDEDLIRIQNPAQKLDHVIKEIIPARFFEIPATAIEAFQSN